MSRPVFLYRFERGTQAWRFAASVSNLTAMTATWVASPVSHSDIEMTGDAERDSVKIEFPETDDFALEYIKNPPERKTDVYIYKLERSNGTSELWWSGRVVTPEAGDGKITLSCEPRNTGMGQVVRPYVAMRNCPHAVYIGLCKLQRANFAKTLVINSISGSQITFASMSGIPDGDLAGGIIKEPSGDERTISSHSGLVVRLDRPLSGLVVGGNAVVYPGCDRSPDRCVRFVNSSNPSGTNIENFGGFSWMLTGDRNPFSGSSAT